MYIYSISAPHLMALLKGARDRGASVRVMYDPVQMRAADVQKLRSFGIEVKVSPPTIRGASSPFVIRSSW